MIFKLLYYYLSLYYWDYATIASVKRMQLKKFRKVFEYARENSRFYRDLYTEHGIMDLKIKTWEDIQKIPVINKAMLRGCSTENIITCAIESRINIHSTSGSSGEPFKIAYSKFEDYSAHVRMTKAIMRYGYTPFKKLALLSRYESGHKFEIEDDISRLSYFQKKLKLFPKKVISIFEPLDLIVKQLEEYKPFIIWSTPSFIHILALWLEKEDRKLEIPICFLMAETISPNQLVFFRERVCKNVIDAYGCMESPSMGFSFNSSSYKDIIVNTTLTEINNIREQNDQNVGDIVITSLINKTMPFIRYDLGDFVGVLPDNDFPIKKIGKVNGRFDDILSFGDNLTLSFHQTYQMFHEFHECEQYKFIQSGEGDIILQLKIKEGIQKEFILEKATVIWKKYYPNSPLIIEFKDSFEIDSKTGKFKVIEKIKKID